MATLNLRTFTELVQTQAAQVQARAAGLVDFSVGSILRAITEAVAAVALWLQYLIVAVLALTRASTSSGADLDSWVADFGAAYPGVPENTFIRLGALGASGRVTFGRYTTGIARTIPLGARVQTQDGSLIYEVIADLTNGAYDSINGNYPMASGAATVSVTVRAVTVGSTGNAQVGTINTLSSPVTGIDYVTNAAAFTNGQDTESDASLRARFRQFILSLREATPAALLYHIGKIQPGLSILLQENVDASGVTKRGLVRVILDDGSGDPPSSLVDSAVIQANAHRAAGVEVLVQEPVIVTVNVVVTFTMLDDGLANVLTRAKAAAEAAIIAYLNSRPVGRDVTPQNIANVVSSAVDGVMAFSVATLNGLQATVVISQPLGQVAKAGTATATATLFSDS